MNNLTVEPLQTVVTPNHSIYIGVSFGVCILFLIILFIGIQKKLRKVIKINKEISK